MTLDLDYYYGMEADQFKFYRFPKVLMTDERFSGLSSDAKILYGLMLDRMSLSYENGWHDENNRIYIIYSIENIEKDLHCSHGKAIKVLRELDSQNGIGLISKVRRGLGNADLIFVKNFMSCYNSTPVEDTVSTENPQKYKNRTSESTISDPTKVQPRESLKFNNHTSAGSFLGNQEVQLLNSQKTPLYTSGSTNIELADVQRNNPKYTDINNTDYINTDSNHIHPDGNENAISEELYISSEGTEGAARDSAPLGTSSNDYDRIRYRIYQQIGYESLKITNHDDMEIIDEIVSLMTDVITYEKESVKINHNKVPIAQVIERFERIDFSTMQYILETLNKSDSKVRNIRSYILTVLYNAPVTINNYYSAEVRHNMSARA